jgi:hypothetical protein
MSSLTVPIYRLGHNQPWHSAISERKQLQGIDGSDLGEQSVTLPARIKYDTRPEQARNVLDKVREFGLQKIISGLTDAAHHFRHSALEVGGVTMGPDEYCRIQSLATGVPERLCRENMDKIYKAFMRVEQTLRGHLSSWRGDISLEDIFSGKEGEGYARQSAILGGIWPSNSSGVFQLLPPGLALGPVLIKPGSGDVLTPLRIREACRVVGLPAEAIGIYPGDGDRLSGAISEATKRRLLFGGADTVNKYHGNPEVEVHGPGCSKIIIGEDKVGAWRDYLDVMRASIMNGSGRGCIACSAIYAPGEIAEELATALADLIGDTQVRKLDDPEAVLAAFGSPKGAENILGLMRKYVSHGGGRFVTPEEDRAVVCGPYSVLRPVVAYLPKVPSPGELSASKFEVPAPAVLVINSDGYPLEEVIGSTLVCTAITDNSDLLTKLADSGKISRLNRRAIPTTLIHVEGEPEVPLEGYGMPRFLFDTELGKPTTQKPTY